MLARLRPLQASAGGNTTNTVDRLKSLDADLPSRRLLASTLARRHAPSSTSHSLRSSRHGSLGVTSISIAFSLLGELARPEAAEKAQLPLPLLPALPICDGLFPVLEAGASPKLERNRENSPPFRPIATSEISTHSTSPVISSVPHPTPSANHAVAGGSIPSSVGSKTLTASWTSDELDLLRDLSRLSDSIPSAPVRGVVLHSSPLRLDGHGKTVGKLGGNVAGRKGALTSASVMPASHPTPLFTVSQASLHVGACCTFIPQPPSNAGISPYGSVGMSLEEEAEALAFEEMEDEANAMFLGDRDEDGYFEGDGSSCFSNSDEKDDCDRELEAVYGQYMRVSTSSSLTAYRATSMATAKSIQPTLDYRVAVPSPLDTIAEADEAFCDESDEEEVVRTPTDEVGDFEEQQKRGVGKVDVNAAWALGWRLRGAVDVKRLKKVEIAGDKEHTFFEDDFDFGDQRLQHHLNSNIFCTCQEPCLASFRCE